MTGSLFYDQISSAWLKVHLTLTFTVACICGPQRVAVDPAILQSESTWASAIVSTPSGWPWNFNGLMGYKTCSFQNLGCVGLRNMENWGYCTSFPLKLKGFGFVSWFWFMPNSRTKLKETSAGVLCRWAGDLEIGLQAIPKAKANLFCCWGIE